MSEHVPQPRPDVLRTDDFDFELPKELIAQRPKRRGESRLLHLPRHQGPQHHVITDLPDLLRPGDLVVTNDTKVRRARLLGRRLDDQGTPGGRAEALLVEPLDEHRWTCMLRPGKRMKPGRRLVFADPEGGTDGARSIIALVLGRQDDLFELRFERPFSPEVIGRLPLPPYIERDADEADDDSYQTIFANELGAVAAPTAGLHFDQRIIEQLALRDIELTSITLHVGPGTFRPVTSADPSRHVVDAERFSVGEDAAAAIERTRSRGGRVLAVGTTVVRTLESMAHDVDTVADADGAGTIRAGSGRTDLLILPGHSFKAVDLLLTNFHLPRSSLLMLVSAFAGRDRVLDAYRLAVEQRYRFYSYGDAMLLEPELP